MTWVDGTKTCQPAFGPHHHANRYSQLDRLPATAKGRRTPKHFCAVTDSAAGNRPLPKPVFRVPVVWRRGWAFGGGANQPLGERLRPATAIYVRNRSTTIPAPWVGLDLKLHYLEPRDSHPSLARRF